MANAVNGRVCKPDCEYWSGAPLSIKRGCRHIVLAQRSIHKHSPHAKLRRDGGMSER